MGREGREGRRERDGTDFEDFEVGAAHGGVDESFGGCVGVEWMSWNVLIVESRGEEMH